MFLIEDGCDIILGETAVGSQMVPRVGEYVEYDSKFWRVVNVVYRLEKSTHMTEPRVDLYVSHIAIAPSMIPKLPWNGIDEDRWVDIRRKLHDIETAKDDTN